MHELSLVRTPALTEIGQEYATLSIFVKFSYAEIANSPDAPRVTLPTLGMRIISIGTTEPVKKMTSELSRVPS